jgi:hypothetical protein
MIYKKGNIFILQNDFKYKIFLHTNAFFIYSIVIVVTYLGTYKEMV